ncbi:MAG: CAP domain-containing protein [Anaerolineales bacterium]|nr:CAP domain-containing protein [Anaerolineales bacterium]MCB9128476.1 CAP domain-containing protein [Ardenticatenales bacterium]MCB9172684.1 CAP domain-containing protein [Ardenticatenales bacterium]
MHFTTLSRTTSRRLLPALVLLTVITLITPLRTFADSPHQGSPHVPSMDFEAVNYGSSAASSESGAAAAPVLTAEAQMTADMFDRINSIRISYGLAPFTRNALLDQAAQAHVDEGAARGWLSHYGVNGSTYYQRVAATGYDAVKVNECIGWGYNLDRMINFWMNSRVHRNMLLSSTYTEVGIGYVGNPNNTWGHWWVVDVALPSQ